jgi:hypothetical protein
LFGNFEKFDYYGQQSTKNYFNDLIFGKPPSINPNIPKHVKLNLDYLERHEEPLHLVKIICKFHITESANPAAQDL